MSKPDIKKINLVTTKMVEVVIDQESLEGIILGHLGDIDDMALCNTEFNYCVTNTGGTQQIKVTVKGQET